MSYSQYEKIVHVNQPTLLQQNTSYSNLDSKRSSELSKFSDIYKSFNSTRKSNDTYEKNKKESLFKKIKSFFKDIDFIQIIILFI